MWWYRSHFQRWKVSAADSAPAIPSVQWFLFWNHLYKHKVVIMNVSMWTFKPGSLHPYVLPSALPANTFCQSKSQRRLWKMYQKSKRKYSVWSHLIRWVQKLWWQSFRVGRQQRFSHSLFWVGNLAVSSFLPPAICTFQEKADLVRRLGYSC